MATYQQRPPTIEALQFTGGAANAQTIIEGISALTPRYTVRFIPESSEYEMQNGAVVEIKFTQRLRIESVDGEVEVNVGDWVFVTQDGFVKSLSNENFIARYQPAP